MVDHDRSVPSDPVELRTQAVILAHCRSILMNWATSFDHVPAVAVDEELAASADRVVRVLAAVTAGIGDGIGALSQLVRSLADQADPSGSTGTEDELATRPDPHDERPGDDPGEVARTLTEAIRPLARQRINLLSASAAVVTQLPTEQLPRFVYVSSHLAVRMVDLTESLGLTGRALQDYAAAMRRTGTSGPDLSLLRSRCLEVFDTQVHRWVPDALAGGAAELAAVARVQVTRQGRTDASRPGTAEVLDSVVPVEVGNGLPQPG